MKFVELESIRQRANYLEAFLPDNFSKPGGKVLSSERCRFF